MASPATTPPQDTIMPYVNELVQNHVRDWTPQTILSASNDYVMLALRILEEDRPEYSNRLLPRGMDLPQFHHMVLREVARRNLFEVYYADGVISRPTTDPQVYATAARNFNRPMTMTGQDVVVTSAAGRPSGQTENATVRPMDAAIYDSAVASVLFENNMQINTTTNRQQYPNFFFGPETVQALGLPDLAPQRLNYGARLKSDVARITLGYAWGSLDDFNPRNPNATLTVSSYPDARNGQTMTWNEYNPILIGRIASAYRAGDQLNPREAVNVGLQQARLDALAPEYTGTALGLPMVPAASRPSTVARGN